jgi:hypothetical protein
MSREVAGVPLGIFDEDIRIALSTYTAIADYRVGFEDNVAAYLELTPDKPNSARSVSNVKYLGEVVATLCIIAFAPGDGTGDESAYHLDNLGTGKYPEETKVLPRSKASIHTEAHLTIASQAIDSPNADTELFNGNLDVLGFKDDPFLVEKIGEVGQTRRKFTASPDIARVPVATATVGYQDLRGHWNDSGELVRFGDPHAIYNPWEDKVQVCGFLAIGRDLAHKNLDALRRLQVNEPRLA